MDIFTSTITVLKSDLDALNHVNNVRYVQWVQDIAEAHWNLKATPSILDNFFWVLISHHISYKSPAYLGDSITLKTFVSESNGATSTRKVEIFNTSTKVLLTTSETKWCLIDKNNKRPTRISKEIEQFFN